MLNYLKGSKMKKKKRIKFKNLKSGQKFKDGRKLYVKDSLGGGTHLRTGQVRCISKDWLVTPVKVVHIIQ